MKTTGAAEACSRLAALAGRGGKGRVHSLFRTAANLEVDGHLLCLLATGRSLHPYSAVLAEVADLGGLGLAPGAAVVLGGNAITIGEDEGKGAALVVRLDEAAPADLSAAALGALAAPADRDGKLAALAEVISQSPGAAEGLAPMLARLAPGKFPPLPTNHWCDFLLPRVRALPAVLRGGEAAAIGEAGRGLAGCGPGLTPSSDDFLVGLAAALWAMGKGGAARALCAGAAPVTGTIPAAYLKSAAQGLFSRDILGLLAAWFSARPPEDVRRAAAAVAGFGSSSGVDILAGLYCGLTLL